jgi:hypothetical protein
VRIKLVSSFSNHQQKVTALTKYQSILNTEILLYA